MSIDWQPSASLETMRARAEIIKRIRQFFEARGFLEVETPVLGRFGVTDRYLENIQAYFRGQAYALQTSPEYHMKRLLAAGSGSIFQIARVFRDDELGRWHNPEFSLLEWYQLDMTHHDLLLQVQSLMQTLFSCEPFLIKTYRQAFEEVCGIDPLRAHITDLKKLLKNYDLQHVFTETETDRDQHLFLLMTHVIEPAFTACTAPVALIDFPPSQASLARVEQGVAQRFEVYYRGVELANGFYELTDFAIQSKRFQADVELRQACGLPHRAIDEYLLAALKHGIPPCSGVALGLDRLMALILGKSCLAEVLPFDFSRA